MLTDPVTGERYLEVHPEEALAQGRWPVPPWTVWLAGAVALLAGMGVLGRRAARARQGR